MLLNGVTGKYYIGSSVDLKQRAYHHLRQLRRNCHFNRHLQAAWNLDGEKAFVFIVLEPVSDTADLVRTEQNYIDRYHAADRHCGYNIRPRAESNLGRKCSPEQVARISRSLTGRPQSQETRSKRSASMRGITKSEETRAKMSAAKRGTNRPDVRTWAPQKFSKFGPAQVQSIRQRRAAGATFAAIAAEFSCSRATAHQVVNANGAFYATV